MSKKLLVAGVIMTLVAAVLVGVGAQSANAMTCADVESLITILGSTPAQATQIRAMAPGCGVAAPAGAYTFTRTLGLGSTGADVTALQNFLISNGNVIPAGATGYYGAQTAAAVSAYQVAKGIANPGTGNFGPKTLASVNANTIVVVPTTPGTTPAATGLTGNAGDITVTSLSTYSGEEVKAGDEGVKVLGLEVEADDGSDVDITSMKVELKQINADSSKRIAEYVDSVDIYMGSTKVGSADASDFTKGTSNIYTKSISLDGAVIEAGAKAKFYVALNAVSSLDSGDIDAEVFYIDVLSMRFMDGDGVTTSRDYTTEVTARTADFVDLTTSGDVEVKISKNSASPSTDAIVEVDDVSNTSDVLLLAVNLKATGSDITVDELNFDITPTGSNANVIVNEYRLLVDGTEVASLSPTSIAEGVTDSITFTDMEDEFAVSDGDTVVVKLLADINDTEGTAAASTTFFSSDSILASLTSTNFALASSTIKDENGDDVANGDRSGSVTGKTLAFYNTGMIVTAVSSVSGDAVAFDTDANSADTTRGDFKIRFTVEAMGMDVYLDKTIAESSSTSATPAGSNRVLVIKTGTGVSTTDVALGGLQPVDAGDVTTGTNTYMIAEGDKADFILSVSSDVNADAQIQAILYGLEWGNADDATGDSVYTFNMGVAGSYKSPTLIVAD